MNYTIKKQDLALVFILLSTMWTFVALNSYFEYKSLWIFYSSLLPVSFFSSIFAERILDCIYDEKMFKKIEYRGLIFISGLFLSLVYGPQFFIKYYEYDDWVYLSYQFQHLDFEYLNTPINYHYVPLYKFFLYYLSKLSDPTYYLNSISFYFLTILILSALGRVLRTHTNSQLILACSLLAFAIWPSFETARTWFGGGFWLSIPVFSFLATLLVTNQILKNIDKKTHLYIKFFVLNTITVLSSSQILFPVILIFLYITPFLIFEKNILKHRAFDLILIFTLSTIPSFLAVLGRLDLVKSNIDYHGIYNGALLRNLAAFVARRVLMIDGREFKALLNSLEFKYFICICLILFSILVFKRLAIFFRNNKTQLITKEFSYPYSLIILGAGIVSLFALQVGIARSWEIYATINAYYCTFPLVGVVLIVSGISSVYVQISDERLSGSKFMSGVYVFLLAIIFIFSVEKYFPNKDYIDSVNLQKAFIKDFGYAVCEELNHIAPGQKLYLVPKYDFTWCEKCTLLFKAPESFLVTSSQDATFFQVLAKSSAKGVCPIESERLLVNKDSQAIVSSGNSIMISDFYQKYYKKTAH